MTDRLLKPVPRLSGRLRPAGDEFSYLWLLLALIGPLPLFLFGIEALLHSWSRPADIVFAFIPVLAGVTFMRALSHLPPGKNVSATRWPGLAGAILALSLATVGNLAWLDDLVILATILWLASLSIVWFGMRQATAFWVPLGMVTLLLPLPKLIANPVLLEFQGFALQFGSALTSLLGAVLNLQDQTMEAGGVHIAIPDAVPSFIEIVAVILLTMLFAGFSRSRLSTRILPIIFALPAVIVVAGIRIGLLGAIAHHLSASAAEHFLQIFGSWGLVGLSALMSIAGAQVASKHLMPAASARRPEIRMGDRDGRPCLTPLSVGLRRQRALAATALLACGASAAFLLAPERAAPDVHRDPLRLFPPEIGGWSGSVSALRPSTEWVLRADDYLNANFIHPQQDAPVNLWIAYYRDQKGYDFGTVHSPKVCLPNNGWTIVSDDAVRFLTEHDDHEPFELNRAVIKRREATSLVYYWLEGRGRRQANEFMARLLVKYDILTKGRSDRAIVRLVTPILPGEPEVTADARLQALLVTILPQLSRFIPE